MCTLDNYIYSSQFSLLGLHLDNTGSKLLHKLFAHLLSSTHLTNQSEPYWRLECVWCNNVQYVVLEIGKYTVWGVSCLLR